MFMAVDLHSFKLLYVEFYVFKTKVDYQSI